MKIAAHQNHLTSNSQEMQSEGYSIGDHAIVVEILRNKLYSKKIQTICQEYISNCKDAHREVGNPKNNFEVVIPTRLNPIFRVRDVGPGISSERMSDVFLKYGNSTKRNDTTQIGGFGLGAKIWPAYSDSFTITTIICGVKRCYISHTGSSA